MPPFWRHCGHDLLDPAANGRLALTDAFRRAFLARPEVAPVPESCAAERALHAALLRNPREAVSEARIAALADPDARDNWRALAPFLAHLARYATVEDAYLAAFTAPAGLAPLFLDQLAHVIVRDLLGADPDPLAARAGELWFRPQQANVETGRVLLADAETVETHARSGGTAGLGGLGALLAETGTPARAVALDVLTPETAARYWGRDEAHDTVLDLTFGAPGLDAFARLCEAWVARMLGVATSAQPVATIRDDRWVWHLGLDAEASRILNALYEGAEPEPAVLAQVLALFRLEIADQNLVIERVRGRPVYMALAMDPTGRVRMKPQNLLLNLPLAAAG